MALFTDIHTNMITGNIFWKSQSLEIISRSTHKGINYGTSKNDTILPLKITTCMYGLEEFHHTMLVKNPTFREIYLL